MNLKKLFKFMSMIFFVMSLGASTVLGQIYVDASNGQDSNDGSSPVQGAAGVGPVETWDAGINLLPNGGTLYVAVGTYNEAQVALDENLTIVGYIPSGSASQDVILTSGAVTSANVTFKVASIGSDGPQAARRIELRGTFDLTTGNIVSESGALYLASGITINRTTAPLGGLVSWDANGTYTLVYNSPGANGALTASGEVPNNFGGGSLTNNRVVYEPLIFPESIGDLTFKTSAGANAILNAEDGDITFNSNIILTNRGIIENNEDAVTPNGGTFIINGDVTISPSGDAIVPGSLLNSGRGSLEVNGDVTVNMKLASETEDVISNTDANGTLTINGDVSVVRAKAANPQNVNLSIAETAGGTVNINGAVTQTSVTNNSTTYYAVLAIDNISTGTISIGSSSGTSEVLGLVDNSTGGTITLQGDLNLGHPEQGTATIIDNSNASSVIDVDSYTLNITSNINAGNNQTITIDNNNGGKISAASESSGVLRFSNTNSGGITGSDILLTNGGEYPTIDVNTSHPITIDANTTVAGKFNLPKGKLEINAGQKLAVKNTFTFSGGEIETVGAAAVLSLEGDFTRTAGTYTRNTGKIQLAGSKDQFFAPGASFTVYDFEVATTNEAKATLKQSLFVKHDFDITTGTLDLSTYNIRMNGSALQTFDNASGYTSSGGGSIVFEVTDQGGNTHAATIQGAGTFSNITINLATSTDFVDLGSDIALSGVLTLSNGQLTVDNGVANAGLELNNDLVVPVIRKNIAGSGANSAILDRGTGTPAADISVATNETYNYTLYGTNGGVVYTIQAGHLSYIPGQLNDLTVGIAAAQTVQAINATNLTITGSLTVNNSTTFDLNASTLTAKGSVTHNTIGTVTNGTIAITGKTVTIQGDNIGSTYGQNVIDNLTIAPTEASDSDIQIVGLFNLTGNLSVTKGNATISMGKDNDDADDLANKKIDGSLTVTGGKLTLGSWIDVGSGGANGVSHSAGIINLASNRLVFSPGAAATYQVSQSGQYEYDDNGGRIVLNDANASFTTSPNSVGGPVAVPNVEVAADVAISDNTEISNFFSHSGGDITVANAKELIFSGSLWLENGGGTIGGAGSVKITKEAEIQTVGGFQLDDVTIDIANSDTLTIKSVKNNAGDAADNATTITSTGTVTFKAGHIALGRNDLSVQTAFVRTAGATLSADAGYASDRTNVDGISRGELVLNGANLTPDEGFVIPNLRIANNAALSGDNDVTITGFFQFGQGGLTHNNDGRINMGQGATIIRDAAGAMDQAPKFNSTINYYYLNTAAVAYSTAKELTTDADLIQNFAVNLRGIMAGVDASGGTGDVTIGTNQAITVNSALDLKSGNLNILTNNNAAITVADSASIKRAAGTIDASSGSNGDLKRAGIVNMVYYDLPGANTNITTATRYWPADASVNEMYVMMGENVVGPSNGTLTMHANRTVSKLFVENRTSGSKLYIGDDAGALATKLTVTDSAAITTGDVTTEETAVISTDISTLEIVGDLNINGGSIGSEQGLNLDFVGSEDQEFMVASGGSAINNLGLKQTASKQIKLSGGNLTVGGTLSFVDGLLVCDDNTVIINGTVNRAGLTGISHIVGEVEMAIPAAVGRYEYPLGSLERYRPFVAQFNTAPLQGTKLTVKHVNESPGGVKNFPLDGGEGNEIGTYPAYYWLVTAVPSLGAATEYDLELTGADFTTPFKSTDDFRIITRFDGNINQNGWSITGSNDTYTNILEDPSDTTVTVRNRFASGGLVTQSSIYAIGLPSVGLTWTTPAVDSVAVEEDSTSTIQFTANPNNVNATVQYSQVTALDWVSIDKTTGLATLTPDSTHVSSTAYDLTVKAVSSLGDESTKTVKVTVKPVYATLEFVATPGNANVKVGQEYSFQYTANGGDGEYSYALVSVAGDATADTAVVSDAGLLTWSPAEADLNKMAIVKVSVTSNSVTVESIDTLNVTENNAPSWAAAGASFLPDTTVYVGDTLKWTYKAIDPDGDAVSYKFGSNFPAEEASLNATTGEFAWAPKTGSAFPVIVPVYASDMEDSTLTEARVTIKVITVAVNGTVKYNVTNKVIPNALVTLKDANGAVVDTDSTDADGKYMFTAVAAGDYTVTASKENGYGGVLASDALMVQQVEAGTDSLDTELQKIAADVDKSGNIDAVDALIILNRSVDNKLPSFTLADWQFETKEVKVTSAGGSADIMGICAGDARSDYNPAGGIAKASVSFDNTEIQKIKKSAEFKLPVSVREEAEVGSFTLRFRYPADQIEFLGVVGSGIVSNVNAGVISLAWANANKPLNIKEDGVLAQLRFKAVEGFDKGSEAGLELLDGSEITDVAAKTIASTIAVSSVEVGIPESFDLGQNYPNPFNPTTTIKYGLPANGKVSLTVFNTLGQVVETLVDTKQEAGEYEVKFNAQSMASGVYLYRIIVTGGTKDFVQTKKMLLLK